MEQTTNFYNLPYVVIEKIFSKFDCATLCKISRVSKQFQYFSDKYLATKYVTIYLFNGKKKYYDKILNNEQTKNHFNSIQSHINLQNMKKFETIFQQYLYLFNKIICPINVAKNGKTGICIHKIRGNIILNEFFIYEHEFFIYKKYKK